MVSVCLLTAKKFRARAAFRVIAVDAVFRVQPRSGVQVSRVLERFAACIHERFVI